MNSAWTAGRFVRSQEPGRETATIRCWAMPSLANVVSVARMTWQPDSLLFERWAESDPKWVRVPSLFRLFHDGEGGVEVTEIEALVIIGRWGVAGSRSN